MRGCAATALAGGPGGPSGSGETGRRRGARSQHAAALRQRRSPPATPLRAARLPGDTQKRTLHADRRDSRRRGRSRVAPALVARAAGRAAGHGAAGVAGRGRLDAGARARHRHAGAPRHGVRLRGDRQRVRLRAGVRRAHEPCRDAGGGAVRAPGRTAGAGLRAGAAAGRAARLRRAARHDAGRGGRGAGGLHAAGAARVGAGRGAAGGGADGGAGAGVLRPVGRARRRAPGPRRAHQARAGGRRARLRRGARDGRQHQPGAQLRTCAPTWILGLSVGVLGRPSRRRGAGRAAAPLRTDAAPRKARGDGCRHTAQRQTRPSLSYNHLT